MAGRGPARNSKRPPKEEEKSPTEQMNELLTESLDYLRKELSVFTSAAGNHAEVIRIAKALRDLGASASVEEVSPQEKFRQDFLSRFLDPEDPAH